MTDQEKTNVDNLERPEDHPMYDIWMGEERLIRAETEAYKRRYFYHYGHNLQYP